MNKVINFDFPVFMNSYSGFRKMALSQLLTLIFQPLLLSKRVFLTQKKLIFLVLIWAGLNSYIFADTLYLKNGSTVEGKLVKEDSNQIVFLVGGEDGLEVTFFKDEIIRIDKSNFLGTVNLSLDKNKNINIPLPDLSKNKPVITEQAGRQIEKKNKMQLNSDIAGVFGEGDELVEKLISVLDKEELDYFMRFNEITRQSATVISSEMMKLKTADNDKAKENQLIGLIDNSSSEIGRVLAQLEQLSVPFVFENFHKDYVNNLKLMKEVFSKMKTTNDISLLQNDITLIQENIENLRKQIEKILNLKVLTKNQE